MNKLQINIQYWLAKQPQWIFAIYSSSAAFTTYSCMYAFRKPFTMGLYENMDFCGVDYKVWIITAQIIGYTLSKFMGIKYVSEMKANIRALFILGLIAASEVALFFFWIVPRPYNVIFMFLNGLPLGMVWGAVFSYLEGRRLTELLGAVLCVSFIVATGVVKSVGELVMLNFHTTEFSMPFITGLIFTIPLVISVFLLDSVPPPTMEDEQLRTKRKPMNLEERMAFFKKFWLGIVFLVATYTFLTIFRELREYFTKEIWIALGYDNPAIYTLAELPIAIITLVSLALITFVQSNIKAFNIILFIVVFGFLLSLGATLLFEHQMLDGQIWMITVGIGLYLGYIPFNAFLYERMISAFKYISNVGFLIYISDAFGYFGCLGVVFYKNFFTPNISWLNFFSYAGIVISILGAALTIIAFFYFKNKYKNYKLKV